MNLDLKNAVKSYCLMLPYANTSSQPNDDRRLYEISYHLVKADEILDEEFFKEELRKNSKLGFDKLNDEDFDDFVKNRISEIQNGVYVIERLSHLIFP